MCLAQAGAARLYRVEPVLVRGCALVWSYDAALAFRQRCLGGGVAISLWKLESWPHPVARAA